jgi:hypothetical protein
MANVQVNPLGTFVYSSLQCLLVYWQVPADRVVPLLGGTGLVPAIFDGQALVDMNLERYASVGSTYDSMTNEVELNVVAYPKQLADRVPQLTLAQFLAGADETKLYGNYRVNVPCDSQVAVNAGSQKYGENKFLASFTYQVPDLNDPTINGWWIRCYGVTPAPAKQEPYIFDLKAAFQATRPGVSPFSPVPAWALLTTNGQTQLVMSARNIYGVFQSWFTPTGATPPAPSVQPLAPGTVQLTVGDEEHLMTQQLQQIFGGTPPPTAVALLLYESPPAAASTHTLVLSPLG